MFTVFWGKFQPMLMTKDAPRTLGFLLFPGFPMACLTSAIEPLRAANEICGRQVFAWRLVGEGMAPVRSSAELRFDVDMALGDMAGVDQLFLISPPGGVFANPSKGFAALRRLDRAGVPLGAFSGGIFPLVRSGVMTGRKCSVHWCYEAAFAAEFQGVEASRSVIVRDGRRTTASGAGAVFDLMLRLIEETLGRDTMTVVACWFQHPFVRDADASQKVPVQRVGGTDDLLPEPIRNAIRLFAEHIEDPILISDVAVAVAMSERHLERSFKAVTGQSPLKYYRLMRLAKARQRVLYSTDTITEIAQSVGYAGSGPMARHYTAEFGLHPTAERRRLVGLRGLSGGQMPE